MDAREKIIDRIRKMDRGQLEQLNRLLDMIEQRPADQEVSQEPDPEEK